MITVGFSKPRAKWKIFSTLIRFYQGTDFSHTYIKTYNNRLDRTMIYEASHGEVHVSTCENWSNENIATAEFDFEIDSEIKVIQYCVDHLQKPYGKLQIIGLLINDLFGKTVFNNKENGFICSELVSRALSGVIDFGESHEYIRPDDIFKKLVEARKNNAI